MKILITGNMGYVGPSVLQRIRQSYPEANIVGLDIGYFAHCLTNAEFLPERHAEKQYFLDVRRVPAELLRGVDVILHLAGISNDPMGSTFEKVTFDINFHASVELARQAKAGGVKAFVFASSCSVYGLADDTPRTETSPLNPLTAYAKSKIRTEIELETLADKNFTVTCLRFATACGMSDRLRLDLVVNDFVACAVSSKSITILSDGTPWRPLIHIRDMARAFDWAIRREASQTPFLAINVGSDEWNYQVKDLADAIAKIVPGVSVSINKNAPQDSRSYRVDFAQYRKLAPNHQPQVDLPTTIRELKAGLESMGFSDPNFRSSKYMRLEVLRGLREKGLLSDNLDWTPA
jgi:nucleoside-diphosphate-sugar epimerase